MIQTPSTGTRRSDAHTVAPAGPDPYTGVVTAQERRVATRSFGWFATRFAVIVVWLLLIVLFSVLEPSSFFTVGALQSILGGPTQTTLVFLCAALLCTILVGEFVDMSVASNFGLAAILISVLNVNLHLNAYIAAIVAIAASTAVGAVNGWLVVKLGVNTIVVTLGMGTFLLGLSLWAANLQPVSGVATYFQWIANAKFLGLPLAFYLGLILMLGFAYLLRFTPLGRNMRFVGENREVSRLAGVRVQSIRFGAFTFAGLIAGLGGVIAAAGTGGFDPNVSNAYLLPMFAATFLGTAIIDPGRFNALGTLLAVFFLATGVLGLQLLGATSWVTDVFYGGVLVVAVTITTILHRRAR
ncbi:ABC transporter permease [Humibacter sp. RRB41]|uniref:ABC transporter permease n=1 Tax=Humibacter sp. RRB41 TaxID=2919946 RepID=UPI001FAB28F2|nr:ABC transporter permease [Humibacter sp. RRB41]